MTEASQALQKNATAIQDEAQKTAVAVAEKNALVPIESELVAYLEAPPPKKQELDTVIAEIDLEDRNSIIFFGSKTQEEMSQISENMLEGVKNKDLGAAGDSLNNMITAIKGFDVDSLTEKPGFFSKMFGAAEPIVKFKNKYEEVRKQLDDIADELETHKTVLLRDIVSLDKLYEANLDFFHKLETYIAAGDEKLRRLDQETIPQLENTAQSNPDEMLKAQELRDLRSARDDLERRVHDLRLTRQVAMQSLPSIRLVQENDKGLVTKISSTLVNTMPLWKNQLAQAVTIYRSGKAAKTVKRASDLTNELLAKNAENLKTANAEVRKQMERGIFDIDTVKKANQDLIDTINESLQIADDGRKARAQAVTEMNTMEQELRQTLIAGKARVQEVNVSNTNRQQ